MNITFEEVVEVVNGARLKVADQLSELECDIGRPLTSKEIERALNCTMCGEPTGNCTHGE